MSADGLTLGSEIEAAARHREVFWAIGRLFLGFLQLTGAPTSLVLLISMGLNRVSIGAMGYLYFLKSHPVLASNALKPSLGAINWTRI